MTKTKMNKPHGYSSKPENGKYDLVFILEESNKKYDLEERTARFGENII
ncbi:MAG: hypothetical protein V1789_10085 [PVC group bacterium]